MWLTRFFQQIKQIVLHFHRMVQLPPQLARVGHADRIHGAHAQLNLARREPREALVRECSRRFSILNNAVQNITRLWTRNREHTPLRGNILNLDIAELRRFILSSFAQEVSVIRSPSTGAHKIIIVLAIAHDSIFCARRTRSSQRIG